MSYTHKYELALKTFIDEITEKGLLLKIKHLEEKRIKEITVNEFQGISRGELTHLFGCPRCRTKWYKYYKKYHKEENK